MKYVGQPLEILIRFYTANQLVNAVRALEANGWKDWETFSPHPVHGIECQTDVKGISRIGFIGGLFGFTAALAMQVVTTSLLYPLAVGGKPLFSPAAFLPIAIESTLLFAAIGIFMTFLWKAGLPCWYRSLFDIEEFRKVSRDAYFVAVYCENSKSSEKAVHLLTQLGGEFVSQPTTDN